MAKVSCNYITKIAGMKISELQKPVVFVVDMINGFTKEGALSDPSILHIVEDIQKLVEICKPSVFICDAHDLSCKEFDSFPLHCVKHTSESEVIDELLPYAKIKLYKNSTNAYMSKQVKGFIEEQMHAYEDIVVVGCCSDLCILQFALSLQAYIHEHDIYHQRVIVPINMIETYHIEGVHDAMKWNERASDMMIMNGIHVVELG